jgi:hypothetical protein
MSKQTVYNIIAAKAEPVKVEFAARDLRQNAEKIPSVNRDLGFFSELSKIESAMSTAIKEAMSLRDLVERNLKEFEEEVNKNYGGNASGFENHKYATRELQFLNSNIADAQKRLQALQRAMGS